MNLASGQVVLSFTKHVLYTMEILVGGLILGSVWEKSLKSFSSFLFTFTSTNGFYPPTSKRGLKLVCIINIVYGHLKSANSQDYVQNLNEIVRTFMNSASVNRFCCRSHHKMLLTCGWIQKS
jgi:hypothetical protein